MAKDPVEAAKWALLYRENSTRIAIGLPNLTPAPKARMGSGLTEQTWAETQSRAYAWTPSSQRANAEN